MSQDAVATPDAVSPDDRPSEGIRRVAMVSLGCPKNLVDSEKMLGLLAEDGVMPVPPEAMEDGGADAAIVNTCGFLEASKDESLGEIEKAAALKRAGKLKRIVVAGCLVQRHRAKLLEWCPDVDALIGVFDRDRIVKAVRGEAAERADDRAEKADASHPLPVYSSIAANAGFARTDRGLDDAAAPGYFEDDAARLRLTPRHFAYLRVSEGCNQNCAFCTIPSIRGKMRSKPIDRLTAEARELIEDGAAELNLIGQDTTSYGQDIGYAAGLSGMLRELDAVAAASGGGAWLRLMYAYPSCFTDEMIDTIAALPHVLPYIDMPLQHINDDVLDRMRRKTSRSLIETLLAKLRDRVPGMVIRTTFITGFPGETEDQHRELVDFVRDFRFDAMGVFPYSPEPGTPAGRLHRESAVPEDVVQRRLDELMTAQQDVAFVRNEAFAADAAEFDVLIDKPTSEHTRRGGEYVGRSHAQAPDIDGITRVDSREELSPGEVVNCRVTAADGYDLVARPVADFERKARLPLLRA